MDDGWPARWPPPPPPPPPPSLPAPAPPPSQMDSVNLRHLFRSFAGQEAPLGGQAAAVPEQLVADPSGSQSSLPVKSVLSNSLLAHVPGNYPHVNHVPDLKELLDRANASNGAGTIDLTRASTLGGTAPLPKYPRQGLSTSTSNGAEQSALGVLFPNRSVTVRGAFPGEVSAKDGISHGTLQFHDSNAHNMQKLPSKPFPRHHPVLLGDRIRVSCLNVGGELFMCEAGLFGVLCLCHHLRMSVAKFCEHAGGPAEKAGEIVHMENGMSIAHWFKYRIGAGASIADTKWEWPEWDCMDTSKEEYRTKSILARNNSTEKNGLLSGYGKNNGPINKPIYDSDVCNEGGWFTSIGKLVNKPDETHYRNSVDAHDFFTKNAVLQQNSELNLGLAKNNTVHAVSLNPTDRPSGSAYFTSFMGGNGSHLAPSYVNLLEKNFDASLYNTGPSSIGVLNYDNRTLRSVLPTKISQNSLGCASNTELKLGQSSYHQSMTTLFPLVQSTTIDFQKSQSHLPLITQNPCPWQTGKDNKSEDGHTEPPFKNKKQSLEVVNDINCSEDDELTNDATKNSLISLFLSHLERNSTSESTDDILNSNEHYLPKALDAAYSSDHSKLASRLLDPRAKNNHSKLASTIIHKKMRSDGRSLPVASSGHIPQDEPHTNGEEPLIHGDCPLPFLPDQPNDGTTKICAGVTCPANCRSHNHVTDKSHQAAHADIGVPCLYGKMARRHSTFECIDDLCIHQSLRASAEIRCQCGKSCSSYQESLPSFGQNHRPTMGKSINGCFCKVQGDVSNLGFRAGQLCRAHEHIGQFYGGTPILAHGPTVEGLDEFCTCSTFIPRTSFCCREHILQSSYHAWPIDGFHHRNSMGHTINNLTKNLLLDVRNKKEPGPCLDGRCCYPVVTKCLAGCGFTKHCDVRIDQSDCAVPKNKHDTPNSTKCFALEESEKLICHCSSNIFARKSNSQASFWKDISQKVMNQPCVPTTQIPKNVSEASVAGGSWPYGSVTEQKGPCKDSGISKDQLKSRFSSGSSSAVVTKFSTSPEFNTVSSCTAKYCVEHRNPAFDEGSRIEKCSSSNYVPTGTGCKQALNSFSRFHLDPSKVKGKLSQISDGSTLKENDNDEQCFQMSKNSRTLRCSAKHSKSEDCTEKINFHSSRKGGSQPNREASSLSCKVSKPKRKHATMHLNKPVKRLHSHHKILKGDDEQSDDEGILLGELSSDRKKQADDMTTLDKAKHQQEGSRVFVRKLPKFVSLNCIVNDPNSEDPCKGSVHIDSSLIATGITNDNRKSPKIVPLDLILKKTKRCHAVKSLSKTENVHFSEEKSSAYSLDESSFGNESCSYSSNTLRSHIEADCKSPCSDLGESKPIGLTGMRTSQLSVSASRFTGIKNRRASISLNRIKMHEEFTTGSTCNPHGDEDNAVQVREVNVGRYKERLNSDAPCCVCGISKLEPCNQIIECSKCYIKVHQACYGVLKVRRGQWFCRPCKINAQGTVCVLCGYGGGAMTRALKAQNVLKSLVKGLTISARSEKYMHPSGNARNECTSNIHGENAKRDYASRLTRLNTVSTIDLQKTIDFAHENIISNSWTTDHSSSLLCQQTIQWVHVVCGLWTPGTKCPNATTMSAFDILGVSPAKRNTACSMCNRTGGSFMECRDVKCSVLFHPWCAHQRGMLQREPEGEHNQNVGFYGTCLDHATLDHPKKKCLRNNDQTCARTEGFGGRKGEDWPGANYKKPEENSCEYSVSQEQINAWLRINGSKSCITGQKEYIHYKQLKGWKHLVVYKSGIHGLGLYTSEFIPRGSMVVEYVGEIVGQRVADKREKEYQSGKRQQYKGACYFFKIDKEHIVDATRKGGIARFINHSCLPNCVAKIISVRNEKKVVFFAERHINPGEEITYDYHFNREDEGQRIPCFCGSRGCRRYLN